MKSNLFARIQLQPHTEYTKDELYDAINTNLHNIINEKSFGIDEVAGAKFDLGSIKGDSELKTQAIQVLTRRIAKYEPRLANFIVELEYDDTKNLSATVDGIVNFDGSQLDLEFIVPVE